MDGRSTFAAASASPSALAGASSAAPSAIAEPLLAPASLTQSVCSDSGSSASAS
jgi:hypothetical protein